jgi:flagellar hook-associated protein 2
MPGLNFVEGLNSNLDTSAIVEAMMQTEMRFLSVMGEQQEDRSNKITTYNAISAMLLGLKSKASLLSKPSSFEKSKISVSNESYATAAVSGDVSSGLYRVKIEQLARNHQIASQGFADIDTTKIGTGAFRIKVGENAETIISVDSTNNTLKGLKDAINDAGAGVSASIINDGSSGNAYRLLLTSSKTGLCSEITVTSELSGGTSPDFSTPAFDSPETVRWSSGATTSISLGESASYSGSANKTYVFTVKGSGAQLIGSGDIELDWTDGTNSGTVTVSSADTEVTLTGDGSDGLTLSLSAGQLIAGDTFQVQTFAPIVQQAQDARISIGSTDGNGSPIVVTSDDNTVEDVIPGVTLNLLKANDTVTPDLLISTEFDTTAVRSLIEGFVETYNEVNDRINEYMRYNEDTEEAGVLLGDSTLLTVQSKLKSIMSAVVDDIDAGYRSLADLGIRSGASGQLRIADPTALNKALEENLQDVVRLFSDWAHSDNTKISFVGATFKTSGSTSEGYDVDITQAATRGYLQGTVIGNPSQSPIEITSNNNTLKIRVDSRVSRDIKLTEKIYGSWEELATEIQQQIDSDENIGSYGVTVDYVDLGDNGYLRLESGSYGSNSRVEIQAGATNSALTTIGLAQGTSFGGLDVVGTINGEKADGTGQILVGSDGNATTEGLKLKVELTDSELLSGTDARLVLKKGIASRFDAMLESLTKSQDGMLARRSSAIQRQVDYTAKRIEDEEARLKLRQEALYKKFFELEKLLGELNSEGAFLESQLNNLSSNWQMGYNNQR